MKQDDDFAWSGRFALDHEGQIDEFAGFTGGWLTGYIAGAGLCSATIRPSYIKHYVDRDKDGLWLVFEWPERLHPYMSKYPYWNKAKPLHRIK